MNTTITVNGITITCDAALAPSIVAEMCKVTHATPQKTTRTRKPAKKAATQPAKSLKLVDTPISPRDARGHQWYDDFKSPNTTVTLRKTQVQVKVARGHASEWHDTLRAEGFTWSKKGFWWASLDDKERQKKAERNRANDAATAGMSKDERRAYWQKRNSSRTVA